MWVLYAVGVRFYLLVIRIASFFVPKAESWIDGRKEQVKSWEALSAKNEKRIWFHCASLGEFEQGRPVLEQLKKDSKIKERIEKFLALVSDETSGFEKKALWRKANKIWLDKSALIAIKILRAISDQKSSQKELAEKMGVSAQYINKIVKGSENLSLETISKLELALGIQLIEVAGFSSSINYEIPESVQPKIIVSSEIMNILLENKYYSGENKHSSGECESFVKAA